MLCNSRYQYHGSLYTFNSRMGSVTLYDNFFLKTDRNEKKKTEEVGLVIHIKHIY